MQDYKQKFNSFFIEENLKKIKQANFLVLHSFYFLILVLKIPTRYRDSCSASFNRGW